MRTGVCKHIRRDVERGGLTGSGAANGEVVFTIYCDVELLLWARVLTADQDPLDARICSGLVSLMLFHGVLLAIFEPVNSNQHLLQLPAQFSPAIRPTLILPGALLDVWIS